MAIRVLLLDDDPAFRHRLAQRLAFAPSVVVAGAFATARALYAQLDNAPTSADVALIDIGLREATGIEVARHLTDTFPDLGILMLTVFEDDAHVLQAIRAGASGYLLKDTPVDQLAAAIAEVHAGGVPLSRSIARRLLRLAVDAPERPSVPPEETVPLSARERELLEHIVTGKTEAAIAVGLGISPHTVRTHVKNIYRKLQVTTRAGAVRRAFEQRLVDPPG
ncbi:MAG: response regulator transcription factor [Gemmatimonadetes bacterium]|nr:response regulator transcription factor [Gemmatimonadota bacterium]